MILKSAILICITTAVLSFDLPVYWLKKGSNPEKYEMTIDRGAGQKNSNAATIKSIDKKIHGFGTIMQTCIPGIYSGKKIKMAGYMKSKNVAEWAGFWLRIDYADSTLLTDSVEVTTLAFDNMHDRAIKGTTDWKKYEVVLDVPLNANGISFGALLSGTGQIWIDNLNFEIADNSTPATKPSAEILTRFNIEKSSYNAAIISSKPANLTFEDY